MVRLGASSVEVALPLGRLLGGRGTRLDPARASVEAGPVDGGVVVDHGGVVGVVNDGGIHVRDRPVIVENTTAPRASRKTNTRITEPLVDAAVKALVRAPVTGVP